jgi:hypothetical protein
MFRDRNSPALITPEASLCALMSMSPLPRRPTNARGHEQIQQARQLTNSVARNAWDDKLPGTTKCRRDKLSPDGTQRNPNGGSNFRLVSPKTFVATEVTPRRGGVLPALAFAHAVLRLLRRSVTIRKMQKSCPSFEPFLSK